jgi:hypothetical protein
MKNNYKGNPTFAGVKDVRLQTWNRCAIVFNLTADRGPSAAKAYLNQFNDEDKVRVHNMFELIGKYGYESIRKRCTPAVLEA